MTSRWYQEAKELMKALLHRDPAKRLGAGHKGYEELKECWGFWFFHHFCQVFFLGGGGGWENEQVVVSNIFYFHPDPWGNDPIWRAYFSDGLVQPPPRLTGPWINQAAGMQDHPFYSGFSPYLRVDLGRRPAQPPTIGSTVPAMESQVEWCIIYSIDTSRFSTAWYWVGNL